MKQVLGAITNLKIPDFSCLFLSSFFENNEIRMHQTFILEVERHGVESTSFLCILLDRIIDNSLRC